MTKKPKAGRALRIKHPDNMTPVEALKVVARVLENFPDSPNTNHAWTAAVSDYYVTARRKANAAATDSFIIQGGPTAWKR